jgi:hypothetical protein
MALIDLDRPAPVRRREPGRPRRIAGTVGLAVLAAGLGGLVAVRWQQQRNRSTAHAVVVADLGVAPPGLDGISDASGGRSGTVRVIGHINVVNTGGAPIRMVAIDMAAFGMRAGAAMPVARTIAPGHATTGTLVVDIDCRNSARLAATPPAVEVEAAHRQVAVVSEPQAWKEQITQICVAP